MGNLIADLKLFLSNGGNHSVLKQDFHWHDDFKQSKAMRNIYTFRGTYV
jgi:hypothetical protein